MTNLIDYFKVGRLATVSVRNSDGTDSIVVLSNDTAAEKAEQLVDQWLQQEHLLLITTEEYQEYQKLKYTSVDKIIEKEILKGVGTYTVSQENLEYVVNLIKNDVVKALDGALTRKIKMHYSKYLKVGNGGKP